MTVMLIWKTPTLKSSFGTLCFSHTVANILILLGFLFWAVPATLSKHEEQSVTYLKRRFGQGIQWSWNVCVFSQLTIAANRLIVLSLPLKKAARRSKGPNLEVRFFVQACIQNGLFMFSMFNFYFLSSLSSNKWAIFLSTTVGWQIIHVLDGLVLPLLMFRLQNIDKNRLKMKGITAGSTTP
ncbi:unnamed protein product [Caenorhabditis auriculariae]|uniref:7TM GPCR serpentine receptor class x (Srx) domain-containing protein n=1 Tax=Caenorhabditis auriculariae TaxID=2777116 RepID=A0A8S1HNP7_9PELO|nr:unnamed protein product [Caenorhabditis auriculariae]